MSTMHPALTHAAPLVHLRSTLPLAQAWFLAKATPKVGRHSALTMSVESVVLEQRAIGRTVRDRGRFIPRRHVVDLSWHAADSVLDAGPIGAWLGLAA